ncbi:fibronectin type III domain-containing protein [Candidatus Poriferisodalis sp.]|uniref:fibronectin type III domain-containing protein n=1 Tax=Candidatus Poriferisodalis sp. TaxID=3101277 RepID=UPI003B0166F8
MALCASVAVPVGASESVPELVGVAVASDAAGELRVWWEAPELAPFEYRVRWARDDLEYLSWRQPDEAGRGNAWPGGDATSVTLSGLDEGAGYKVMVRARFRTAEGKVAASPWSDELTVTVAAAPVASQHQQDPYQDDQSEQPQQDDQAEQEVQGQQEAQQQEQDDQEQQQAQQKSDPQQDEEAQQGEAQQSQQQEAEDQQAQQSEQEQESGQQEQGSEQAQEGSEGSGLGWGEIGGFVVSSGAPGELTISWSTPDPVPDDYRVMWAQEDLGWLTYRRLGDGETRGNLYPAGDVTSFTLRNLPVGVTYKVQMRARYGVTGSGPFARTERSGPLTGLATVEIADTVPLPGAPRLTGTALGPFGAVTLWWAAPAEGGPVEGYRVWRGPRPDELAVIADGLAAEVTTYTDTTTPPGQTLHYAVQAYNGTGTGPASGALSAATPALPQARAEPVLIEPVLVEFVDPEPLIAAPQNAETPLVTNFAYGTASATSQLLGGAVDGTAQAFQLDPSSGSWRLEAVELQMRRRQSSIRNRGRVTIHASQGHFPGEVLWELTPPADYLTDADTDFRTYRFSAPEGAVLEQGDTYWLVLEHLESGAAEATLSGATRRPAAFAVLSDNQDGPGFSIWDYILTRGIGDAWNLSTSNSRVALAVYGEQFDEPGNEASRSVVAAGGSVGGAFHRSRDVDWFKMTGLEAGRVYVVDVRGGSARRAAIVAIYDSDGAQLAGSGASNDYQLHSVGELARRRAYFSPPSDGDYFVGVELPHLSGGVWAFYSDVVSDPASAPAGALVDRCHRCGLREAYVVLSTYTVAVTDLRSTTVHSLGTQVAADAATVAVGSSVEGFLHDSFTLGALTTGAGAQLVRVEGLEAGRRNQFTLRMHDIGGSLLNDVRPFISNINVDFDVASEGMISLHDFGVAGGFSRTSGSWEHWFTQAASDYVRTAANFENEALHLSAHDGSLNQPPSAYLGSRYTLYAWGEAEDPVGEAPGEDLPGTDGWRWRLRRHLFTPGFVSADAGEAAVSATVDRDGDSDWFRAWMSMHDYNTATVTQTASAGCLRVRMYQSPTIVDVGVPWVRGESEWSNATRITAAWDPYYDHGGLREQFTFEGIHYISVEAGPLYTHNTDSTTRCTLAGLSNTQRADYTRSNPRTEYTVTFTKGLM